MISAAIDKLRSDISNKSRFTYENISEEYDIALVQCDQNDKSKISISILIDLYRNLDHGQWKQNVNSISLAQFILKCCHNIICTTDRESKQYFTSLCNLHRYLIKTNLPLELGMALSKCVLYSEPVEKQSPLYAQIYWIVFVDKLSFLEQNKSIFSLEKIHPGIISDTQRVMYVSELIPFCQEHLLWLLNKITHLFGDECDILHIMYKNIFLGLNGHRLIKTRQFDAVTSCRDILYKSLFRSFPLVLQGAFKHNFRRCALVYAVKFTISLLRDIKSAFGLLNLVYTCLPGILVHYTAIPDTTWEVLQRFLHQLKNVDNDIAKIALPNISRMACLHVDHLSRPDDANSWMKIMNASLLKQYINLLTYFIEISVECDETVVCGKCSAKTGLHDCIRIWASGRQLILTTVRHHIAISTILLTIEKFILLQLAVPLRLKQAGCINWKPYFSAHAADLHNDSIVYYEYGEIELSRNVLSACIKAEMALHLDSDSCENYKQIASRFYNLSLCELNLKKYDMALMCAFAAAICGDTLGFSVVMKVKHEVNNVKDKNSDGKLNAMQNTDNAQVVQFQMQSVLDVAVLLSKCDYFGDMMSVLSTVGDLSPLLLKEVERYTEQWGATYPLAGVCKAFITIIKWSTGKDKSQPDWLPVPMPLEATMYAGTTLILAARTTSSLARPEFEELSELVTSLLRDFLNKMSGLSTWEYVRRALILATCLYLKTEFKLAAVRQNFQSTSAQAVNTAESADEQRDDLPAGFTLEQEGEWLKGAMEAADVWVSASRALQNWKGEVQVPQEYRKLVDCCVHLMLANLELLRAHQANVAAIKTAWAAALIGDALKDGPAVLRSVGYLISRSRQSSVLLEDLVSKADTVASMFLTGEVQNIKTAPTEIGLALSYLLDLAVYKRNTLSLATGAVILRSVQSFTALNIAQDANFTGKIGLAYAKLLDVQALFCSDGVNVPKGDEIMLLSLYTNAFREIASLRRNTKVAPRSAMVYDSLNLSLSIGQRSSEVSSGLGLVRRSRMAAIAAQRSAVKSGANARATTLLLRTARSAAECDRFDDCQVKLTTTQRILGINCTGPTSTNDKEGSTSDSDDLTSIADLFASNCALTVISAPVKLPEIIIRAASVRKKATVIEKLPTATDTEDCKICDCSLCTEPSRLIIHFEYWRTRALNFLKMGDTHRAVSDLEEAFKVAETIERRIRQLGQELSTISQLCSTVFVDDALEELNRVHCWALLDFSYIQTSINEIENKKETLRKLVQLADSLRGSDVLLMQAVTEAILSLVFESRLLNEEHVRSVSAVDASLTDLSADFHTPTVKICNASSDSSTGSSCRNNTRVKSTVSNLRTHPMKICSASSDSGLASNSDGTVYKTRHVKPVRSKVQPNREKNLLGHKTNICKKSLRRSASPGKLDSSDLKTVIVESKPKRKTKQAATVNNSPSESGIKPNRKKQVGKVVLS